MQRPMVLPVLLGLLLALAARMALAQESPASPAASEDAQAASIAEGDEASDGSAPDAEAQADEPRGPWLIEHLKAGGTVTVIQLVLSVVGLGVLIERLIHLRRGRIVPDKLPEQADKLWRAGKYDELNRLAANDGSVLGQVIQTIVKHRHLPAEQVSMLAGDVASREMRRHLQKCYGLAIVATLAPLLGLLGTVIGMIEAFEAVSIAGSMGDPSILADSISKALITTEVGLAIAIPALFAYHVLKSRASVLGTLLEEDASDLVAEWKMTGPSPAATPEATAPTPPIRPVPAAKP